MENKRLEVVFSTEGRTEPEPEQVVIYVKNFTFEKNQICRFRCRLSHDRDEVGGNLFLGLMPASGNIEKGLKSQKLDDSLLFEELIANSSKEPIRFFTMLPDMEELGDPLIELVSLLCEPR